MFDRSPHRTCLFLDVDGSLIDIAARPDAVVVPPSLVRNLDRVNAVLDGAVALVSGRSIAQLDALFRPLVLRASGVHGAEMRFEPEDAVSHSPEDAVPHTIRDQVNHILTRFPGTMAEDKGFSLAVHYRATPKAAAALRDALDAMLARHLEYGLQILPGHFVFDIKRPTFDKGVAVKRFLAQPRFAGRRPIYIGDDVTDWPGFSAVLQAGGEAYGVGAEIEGNTGTFANPSAVRTWVQTIATQEIMPA